MKNNKALLGEAQRAPRLKRLGEAPRLKRLGKGGHTLIAATVTIALGLAGCQHIESIVAKKPPVPPSLLMQEKKPEPETKPTEAPAAKKGLTEKEYYPPTGSLVGPSAGAPAVPHAKEGKYTLNFDDADLAEVTKVILGDTLKVNYVLSPKVTGKVSLQTTRPLTDDELIPTLEMLLQTNGAALIKDGPIYRIEPEANATMAAPGARLGLAGQSLPPGYQLRVVPLRYVGVKDMQKVVEPLMPPKSIVRADEIRNLLLLAGSSEELESVIETIRIFDVDFMRGMSVGIYPLKNVDAATIIEDLEKLLGDAVKGPLGGMFRLLPIQRLNAILAVSPQPRYLDEVESWIERLDRYETTKTGNMHVYRVQNVDAVELARTLSQIFGGGAAARGTPGAQLAPGLTGAAISGGAFGAGGGGAFGGTTGGAFGGGGAYEGQGISGTPSAVGGGSTTTTGIGAGTTTGGGLSAGGIGTPSTSAGGLGGGALAGGGMAGGTLGGGTTAGRAAARGSVVAELGNDRRVVADPANNALIIFAKAQDYKDIENVIKELDVMPLQVLIDATIVEVTLTGNLQYGIKWLFTQGSNAEALAGTSTLLGKIKDIAITGSSPGGFAYAFAGKDIKVVINALASDNKINVVSSPSLMVLNNQEANINVGDRVPTSTGGGIVTTSGSVQSPAIQYVDSGVTLKVRPRVNAGGLVIMDIIQAISTPFALTNPSAQNPTPLFQFANRTVQSQVAVNNGDTLALSGLIQNRDNRTETGIPYLNKIPLLGWLFGSTSKNVVRTELVVLLTPRVVEKRGDVTAVANEFRRKLTGIFEEYRLSREAPGRPPVTPYP